MKQEDFIRAVRNMRSWQKAYFERRTPYALQEAKRFEREVDAMLAEEAEPKLDMEP